MVCAYCITFIILHGLPLIQYACFAALLLGERGALKAVGTNSLIVEVSLK